MSDYQYIDVDDDDFDDAPRALREHVKKLQKQLTQVTNERDEFKSKYQSKSAVDALAGYGFRNSKRVSKDLLADGVDLSDLDAVRAWVEENGDDYARTTTETGGGSDQEAAQPEQTVDHSEEAQQRRLAQEANVNTGPAGGDRMQAALAEITDDMDGRQVMEIYKKHGI